MANNQSKNTPKSGDLYKSDNRTLSAPRTPKTAPKPPITKG